MARLGLPLAVVVMVLDQLSKWWVVEKLFRPDGVLETPFYSPIHYSLLPIFDLVMAWNRGVSFGLLNRLGDWASLALSGLSVVICLFLLAWMRRARSRLVVCALGMIIGGALGNVIDRLRFGAVADFLDFHVSGWHWPAFNLADSAITVGAVVLVLDSLFPKQGSVKN